MSKQAHVPNKNFQTLTYSRVNISSGWSEHSGTNSLNSDRVKELKLPQFSKNDRPKQSAASARAKKSANIALFSTSSFPNLLDKKSSAEPEQKVDNQAEQQVREECRRQAEAEKDRILTSAEAEAAGILISAEADAEDLKRETFAKAQEEGLKDARDRISEHLAKLDELFESLLTTQKRCYQQHEEEMVNLALTCAKRIINREISLDEKVIVDTISEVLKEGEIQGDISLLINHEDFQLIDDYKPELLDNFPNISNLKIETSDTIERGGCILESSMGRIDASLRSKFEELERLLNNG